MLLQECKKCKLSKHSSNKINYFLQFFQWLQPHKEVSTRYHNCVFKVHNLWFLVTNRVLLGLMIFLKKTPTLLPLSRLPPCHLSLHLHPTRWRSLAPPVGKKLWTDTFSRSESFLHCHHCWYWHLWYPRKKSVVNYFC